MTKFSACLCLISVLLTPTPTAHALVVDPGHGGADTGVSGCQALKEKELTLDMAERLRRLAQESGHPYSLSEAVRLTRSSDTDVVWSERLVALNAGGRRAEELYLSLHADTAPSPQAQGIRLYVLMPDIDATLEGSTSPTVFSGSAAGGLRTLEAVALDNLAESERLATELQDALSRRLPTTPVHLQRGQYTPLMGATSPSVMVGLGFLSSPDECRRLIDDGYRDNLARALLEGIAVFRKQSGRAR